MRKYRRISSQNKIQKKLTIKDMIDKLDVIKIKNFHLLKDTIKIMNKVKTLKIHISKKGLVS